MTKDEFNFVCELLRCVALAPYETSCEFRGLYLRGDMGYVCEFLENLLLADNPNADSLYLWRIIHNVNNDEVQDEKN